MKIDSTSDLQALNERFNRFHDALIKRLVIATENELLTHMPFEEALPFESNEDELENTGLCIFDDHLSIELEIHHYNYDWPKQPRRRAILIRATSQSICQQLSTFIGSEVYEMSFEKTRIGVACQLIYHQDQADILRTGENGSLLTLFSATEIEITETVWKEEDGE